MRTSVFDLFKIGVGPSSSHTVGPMLAAARFAERLRAGQHLHEVSRVRVELFGSLGATGHGHGSIPAVVLGLMGNLPDRVDPDRTPALVRTVADSGVLSLAGERDIPFSLTDDLVLHRRKRLEFHSNAMMFQAWATDGRSLAERTYYSIGGGFVLDEEQTAKTNEAVTVPAPSDVELPFFSGDELLVQAADSGLPISGVVARNERTWRSEDQIRQGLLDIWAAMQACVTKGIATDGVLPGGLKVRRRAKAISEHLASTADAKDPLDAMDWVTLYALAVNEENAAGGRVVTAPTNGAAGIIPAVLHYYWNFVPGADLDGIIRFLLVAGGIGSVIKENASISGAEVGCQGEIGSACSMAAAGLAEVLGGTPEQVENAAEIGIEHNLGLTCDPVGGLVQIPCIERNAVGAVKAITAARMAVRGDGKHHVSLDKAVKTMRETGADMKDKYKETARGGLALNIVEC
ncbi:MAG: L-serine ammonia-lyase [Mycetocola sp.]